MNGRILAWRILHGRAELAGARYRAIIGPIVSEALKLVDSGKIRPEIFNQTVENLIDHRRKRRDFEDAKAHMLTVDAELSEFVTKFKEYQV